MARNIYPNGCIIHHDHDVFKNEYTTNIVDNKMALKTFKYIQCGKHHTATSKRQRAALRICIFAQISTFFCAQIQENLIFLRSVTMQPAPWASEPHFLVSTNVRTPVCSQRMWIFWMLVQQIFDHGIGHRETSPWPQRQSSCLSTRLQLRAWKCLCLVFLNIKISLRLDEWLFKTKMSFSFQLCCKH